MRTHRRFRVAGRALAAGLVVVATLGVAVTVTVTLPSAPAGAAGAPTQGDQIAAAAAS